MTGARRLSERFLPLSIVGARDPLMLQWLKNVLGMQMLTPTGEVVSPFIDRSALADFVRLLHEADQDDDGADHTAAQ